MLEQEFAVGMPLQKSVYRKLPNGNLLVGLVCSDPTVDLQGEITDPHGFRDSLRYLEKCGTVNWDHAKGTGSVFGRFRKALIGTNPENGQPALLGITELYRHCPQTQDIKRILDSDGRLFASVQGKVLQKGQRVVNGRNVAVNMRSLATAVALTTQPVNPACGMLDLFKSFAVAEKPLNAQEAAAADAWMQSELDKALTTGEGIPADGTTGGAALRTQSLDGSAKHLACPACGWHNPNGSKLCSLCSGNLGGLAKSQMALFGEKPKPSPEGPPKSARTPSGAFSLPRPMAREESVQHSLLQPPTERVAAHDAWHKHWQQQGTPVENSHHNVPQIAALYQKATAANDAGAASFHKEHLRHILDFHGTYWPRNKQSGEHKHSEVMGKSCVMVSGAPVVVTVAPMLVIAKPQDDGLPGEDLAKAPRTLQPTREFADHAHGMDGLTEGTHASHLRAHAQQVEGLATEAKAAGHHFVIGRPGYVGEKMPAWNTLQNHMRAHMQARAALKQQGSGQSDTSHQLTMAAPAQEGHPGFAIHLTKSARYKGRVLHIADPSAATS